MTLRIDDHLYMCGFNVCHYRLIYCFLMKNMHDDNINNCQIFKMRHTVGTEKHVDCLMGSP
jgi:hypothetical protein